MDLKNNETSFTKPLKLKFMPWPNSPSSTGEPRGTGNDPLAYHGVPNYSNPPEQSQSMADNTKEGEEIAMTEKSVTNALTLMSISNQMFGKHSEQSPTPVSDGKDIEEKSELDFKLQIGKILSVNDDNPFKAATAIYKEIIEPLKKENEEWQKEYKTLHNSYYDIGLKCEKYYQQLKSMGFTNPG